MQRMWEGYSRGSCIYQNKEKNGAAYPLWVYAVQERKRAMERLTHPRSSGIKTGYWSPNKKDELIERLAVYEDTGLTPEEIKALNANGKTSEHRWIPVEERLPEESLNSVIGWDKYRERCCFVQYYAGSWHLGDESVRIIAWMPLPEPYRKEERE